MVIAFCRGKKEVNLCNIKVKEVGLSLWLTKKKVNFGVDFLYLSKP